jgi:hypothetical protein
MPNKEEADKARGRVVSESETGDFRPGMKRKFL